MASRPCLAEAYALDPGQPIFPHSDNEADGRSWRSRGLKRERYWVCAGDWPDYNAPGFAYTNAFRRVQGCRGVRVAMLHNGESLNV